jgi:hypothetical protein
MPYIFILAAPGAILATFSNAFSGLFFWRC